MSKENQKTMGRKVIAALLLSLAVAGALKLFGLYSVIRVMTAESLELPSLPQEREGEEISATISDEELEQLLSGEITLDNLTGGASASVDSEEAADFMLQEETVSSEMVKEEVVPSDKVELVASSASSNELTVEKLQEAAYETEVKALIQQAYALKATAEKGLDSSISAAKAEYKALPESQQTQTKKIMICLSKAGELTSLQSYCDKEMDRIVRQLRTVLKENGQSTALADQVMSTYKTEKSKRYTALKNKLYNGS